MANSTYLTDVDECPADSPLGCPHIIKDAKNFHLDPNTNNLHLADLVATVLYYKAPATKKALKAFLDLEKDFRFHRRESVPGKLDFSILRIGKTVQVDTPSIRVAHSPTQLPRDNC